MSDGLLPCPFCGGAACLQPQQGNNRKPFAWDVIHSCEHAFIRFYPRDGSGHSTEAEAIAAWNMRVPQPITIAQAARVLLDAWRNSLTTDADELAQDDADARELPDASSMIEVWLRAIAGDIP